MRSDPQLVKTVIARALAVLPVLSLQRIIKMKEYPRQMQNRNTKELTSMSTFLFETAYNASVREKAKDEHMNTEEIIEK